MKTLSFLCGVLMLFSVGASALGHTKNVTNSKSKKPQMATVTLTAIPITVPSAGYGVILTMAGHRYTGIFPPGGGSNTIMVPPGIYTVAIDPFNGSGTTHTYHASDCSGSTRSKTGTTGGFTHFNVICGSGQLSIVN